MEFYQCIANARLSQSLKESGLPGPMTYLSAEEWARKTGGEVRCLWQGSPAQAGGYTVVPQPAKQVWVQWRAKHLDLHEPEKLVDIRKKIIKRLDDPEVIVRVADILGY